ncbi:NUDIX hydrolase [Oceanispirochaeta sp.]|uniref:NUDIX hydrolase n=1 Tax=Oceanispirochaeta sp. TaxID=2035350 RepID=UPI0026112D7A|nr:NUDIX hydrolase [Oceanispirochaeta sp.]MDA3958923.1 NUDIX hydrolase [Oceanispirochaeta sp.]
MKDIKLVWKDLGKSEELWRGPIFAIDQVMRENPDGKERAMIVCKAPDWVTVIPEIPGASESEFLMVRQFRHGSGKLSCEFPAGVIDPGETALDAAHRELREETGFTASEMILIGEINPNPAFMDNLSTTFLARGLIRTHDLDLDENEYLEWRQETFTRIAENMGLGEYNSAIMVQCWYWYLKFKGIA